ncbi:unnamed protein product [Amoebophrya sp. A25]|nr:unnamed protein product [Amoebophrya sp. A25]|eukprot:GSA25T00020467001.1
MNIVDSEVSEDQQDLLVSQEVPGRFKDLKYDFAPSDILYPGYWNSYAFLPERMAKFSHPSLNYDDKELGTMGRDDKKQEGTKRRKSTRTVIRVSSSSSARVSTTSPGSSSLSPDHAQQVANTSARTSIYSKSVDRVDMEQEQTTGTTSTSGTSRRVPALRSGHQGDLEKCSPICTSSKRTTSTTSDRAKKQASSVSTASTSATQHCDSSSVSTCRTTHSRSTSTFFRTSTIFSEATNSSVLGEQQQQHSLLKSSLGIADHLRDNEKSSSSLNSRGRSDLQGKTGTGSLALRRSTTGKNMVEQRGRGCEAETALRAAPYRERVLNKSSQEVLPQQPYCSPLDDLKQVPARKVLNWRPNACHWTFSNLERCLHGWRRPIFEQDLGLLSSIKLNPSVLSAIPKTGGLSHQSSNLANNLDFGLAEREEESARRRTKYNPADLPIQDSIIKTGEAAEEEESSSDDEDTSQTQTLQHASTSTTDHGPSRRSRAASSCHLMDVGNEPPWVPSSGVFLPAFAPPGSEARFSVCASNKGCCTSATSGGAGLFLESQPSPSGASSASSRGNSSLLLNKSRTTTTFRDDGGVERDGGDTRRTTTQQQRNHMQQMSTSTSSSSSSCSPTFSRGGAEGGQHQHSSSTLLQLMSISSSSPGRGAHQRQGTPARSCGQLLAGLDIGEASSPSSFRGSPDRASEVTEFIDTPPTLLGSRVSSTSNNLQNNINVLNTSSSSTTFGRGSPSFIQGASRPLFLSTTPGSATSPLEQHSSAALMSGNIGGRRKEQSRLFPAYNNFVDNSPGCTTSDHHAARGSEYVQHQHLHNVDPIYGGSQQSMSLGQHLAGTLNLSCAATTSDIQETGRASQQSEDLFPTNGLQHETGLMLSRFLQACQGNNTAIPRFSTDSSGHVNGRKAGAREDFSALAAFRARMIAAPSSTYSTDDAASVASGGSYQQEPDSQPPQRRNSTRTGRQSRVSIANSRTSGSANGVNIKRTSSSAAAASGRAASCDVSAPRSTSQGPASKENRNLLQEKNYTRTEENYRTQSLERGASGSRRLISSTSSGGMRGPPGPLLGVSSAGGMPGGAVVGAVINSSTANTTATTTTTYTGSKRERAKLVAQPQVAATSSQAGLSASHVVATTTSRNKLTTNISRSDDRLQSLASSRVNRRAPAPASRSTSTQLHTQSYPTANPITTSKTRMGTGTAASGTGASSSRGPIRSTGPTSTGRVETTAQPVVPVGGGRGATATNSNRAKTTSRSNYVRSAERVEANANARPSKRSATVGRRN